MTETVRKTEPIVKKKRRIKFTDILLFIVFAAIIIALLAVLMNQLNLRHEVNSARVTTDKLVTAMKNQDGEAARLLGDASFKNHNNPEQLHTLFAQAKPYINSTPTVPKQTFTNGKVNKVVSVYYKFNNKQPFYVRVTVVEPNSGQTSWRVINFGGNQSLTKLTQ